MTRIALVVAALAPLIAPVLAQAEPAQISLLPGWRMENGTRMAALRIELAPGWKTYWRSPGDAGIPPQLDWSGSDNLASVRVLWPAPEALDSAGMRIIAYRGDVVLPVELTPRDPDAAVTVDLRADIGVCNDICVPVSAALRADIPVAVRRDPAIVAALLDRPAAGRGAMRCDFAPTPNGLSVQVKVPHPPAEAVIELGDPRAWVSVPQVSAAGAAAGLTAQADIIGEALALDRSALRLTLLPKDGSAVEYIGCD